MGIIPTPITPGNNCAVCFNPGLTPDLMKVFFSGIEIGDNWHPGLPLPPNGYFDYLQTVPAPCVWAVPVAQFFGQLWYTLADTTLGLAVVPGFVCFAHFSGLVCGRYLTSSLLVPAGNFYYGGQAFVCTPEEMEAWIQLATPVTGPDPRMECFPMPNGEFVLKFCNIQDGTNIKIKLDTALL